MRGRHLASFRWRLGQQQADLFHERSCVPIIRLAADLAGLQFEDGRAAHRRKPFASGRYPRQVTFVCARNDPLDYSPLASGKPISQSVFEVKDCGKGAVREGAKFLFASSDHAEGNVLENTVVDKK